MVSGHNVSRWTSDNYITSCHRRLGSVGGSSVPVAVGGSWEPAPDRGLGALSDPRLSSPARMRKKYCYQKNFGSICGSLSTSPTHLSHITNINPYATLSWIKCEKYIFLKKCVRSFIEVRHYVWLCLCLHMHVYVYVYMYYEYTTIRKKGNNSVNYTCW